MNKSSFCRLIAFDCKRGFRENLVKWGVAFFLFAFLINVTIKNCLIYHEEMGYLGYLTYLFQGMPEYIKSETSIFELPVCWFLYYAYLFFLTGFYPISDLYGCGMKTLLSSGNRKKWMTSKYLWIAINIIFYFFLMLLVLFISTVLIGRLATSPEAMNEVFGMEVKSITSLQMIAVWIVLPVLISISIAFMQFTITIYLNALAGFTASVILLVTSVYWMKPFLIGNYLMLIRNELVREGGMKLVYGIAACFIVSFLSMALGYYHFNRKDIYGSF